MKFLIILLVISPIYVIGDVLGDLLGEELYLVDNIRAKRQTHAQQQQINYRPYSQAPAQIKQLLASQQTRDPLVHIPAQPAPQLSNGPRPEPVYQSQAQVASYKPEIRLGSAPQQPSYKQIPVAPAQYRPPAGAAQAQGRQYTPQYQSSAPRASYQPQAQAQPQYSKQLPSELRQLLQIQAGLPNAIPHGRQG
ncbi:DNA translocase FtsK-like [Vespa mandarinia]|uniref:DNA translocase FtsK-like n=1 Tax=Vespa mandarinia TaxID=7446 RepID=UPI00160AC8E1|nr:DNA translocase FtsK-like [Vespa mandarinia]